MKYLILLSLLFASCAIYELPLRGPAGSVMERIDERQWKTVNSKNPSKLSLWWIQKSRGAWGVKDETYNMAVKRRSESK